MKHFALILFLHLSQAYGEDCKINHSALIDGWEQKLREKLLCNYNYAVPPEPRNGSDPDTVDVSVRLAAKKFNFDSSQQKFSVMMFTSMSWEDSRLKWDPKDYDGLRKTKLHKFNLWMPGIQLFNSISDSYDESYDNIIPCTIISRGRVLLTSRLTFTVRCATNVRNWPFDTQVCKLEFGPWQGLGVKVRLHFGPGIIFSRFKDTLYGTEWDIVKADHEENLNATIQLKVDFTLVRHAGSLAAIVIYPSLMLSALTLSTIFMDIQSGFRVFIQCFSLACHFYLLTIMTWIIPEHSGDTPTILLYFRGSYILTFTSIAVTYFLRSLCGRKAPVPNYISVANVYAQQICSMFGKSNQRIITKDGDDGESGLATAWIDFAILLNCVWIFLSVLMYIIVFGVFVPFPSGPRLDV